MLGIRQTGTLIHLKRLGDRLVETQFAPSPTSRFVVSLHQMLPSWSTPACTHDVTRVKTAIDEEVSSVDIRRVVRCHYSNNQHPTLLVSGGPTEHDRLGLLDGLAESAHGIVDHSPVQLFWRVEEIHEEWCSNGSPTCAIQLMPEHLHWGQASWHWTHGHSALNLIPSLAWTMASSRVMASTAPLEAVSTQST